MNKNDLIQDGKKYVNLLKKDGMKYAKKFKEQELLKLKKYCTTKNIAYGSILLGLLTAAILVKNHKK